MSANTAECPLGLKLPPLENGALGVISSDLPWYLGFKDFGLDLCFGEQVETGWKGGLQVIMRQAFLQELGRSERLGTVRDVET